MSSIGMSVYGIRVQDRETNQNLSLNNLEGRTFLRLVNEFVEEYSREYSKVESLEKIFKTEKIEMDTYSDEKGNELFKYYFGRVKTGAYGYTAEIVNSDTSLVNYTKSVQDAEVMPFCFMLCIPNGNTLQGILILQNHGIYGIKTVFQNKLEKFIKEKDKNYNIIVGNIAPRVYVRRFLEEGILKKVRFLRYDIPQDNADRLQINNGVKFEGYEEYVIHKPIGFLQKTKKDIEQYLRGQRAINNIVEINHFDYDNIKMDFKLGRKNKTLDLKNIDSVVINEDITDSVKLIDGHPTRDSIKPVLLETANDYLNEMGLI